MMSRPWHLLVVLVVFLVKPAESGWCERIECKSQRVTVCALRTWQGCCWYKTIWKTVRKTVRYCCQGYRGRNCNTAICNPPCANGGTCISPGVCRCTRDYTGPSCRGDAPCSLRSPCYPGFCDRSCSCQSGFSDRTCLTLNSDQAPLVWQTHVRLVSVKVSNDPSLNGMLLYELTADSSNPNINLVDEIWSNQAGFNYLEVNGAAQFDPQNLFPKPRYVGDAEFGVTEAVATVVQSKLAIDGGGRYTVTPMNYTCVERTGSDVAAYWNCTAQDTKFNQQIKNADELEVTLTFKSGGYRQLIDPDTRARRSRQTYREQVSQKKVKFRFDLNKPVHCSESSSSCTGEPLSINQDITKSRVEIRWDGWSDTLSGMYRYAWEVFQLKPYTLQGQLREPEPLKPLVNTAWFVENGTFPVYFTAPEPGVYSVILEASDLANNSRYARRLFIYDNVSDVTVSNSSLLFVSSAAESSNYAWQSDLTNDIVIDWTGHFLNHLHEDKKMLNEVLPYPVQFTDIKSVVGTSGQFTLKRVDFDDTEGSRTVNAIRNTRGIVKFELSYDRDHNGGRTVSPKTWTTFNFSRETFIISGETRRNGDSVRVWVRATDVMGNQKVDSTLVSFDDSPPSLDIRPIQKNVENGEYPFSSVFNLTTADPESGIWSVKWKLSRDSNGDVQKTGQLDLAPYKVAKQECDRRSYECRCTPTDDCYITNLSFELNHCWLVVGKRKLGSEVINLEVNITNPAMLVTSRVVPIRNIPSFSGIGQYSAPTDVRVIRGGFNTVRISWNNTPSCYNISELWINFTGDPEKRKIHRLSQFYDLTGLTPETNYTAQLITGYSGEMSDPVSFVFKTGPAPESAGLTAGGRAGLGVGLTLFVLLIVVGVILLWHFGIIAVAMGRHKEGKMTKAAVAFSRMSRKVRGAAVDDDIYVYGGDNFDIPLAVQVAASRLALEELIAEGKFARVYRASLSSSTDMEKQTVVAKMAKASQDPTDRQLMKGKILFYINEVGEHRNILRMIGAMMENDDYGPVMILEYCEMGPMRSWLVKQKSQVTDDVIERMFQFAHGIVQGMSYLAQTGIVHRRLAARNILLTFLLEVRISGFGPTQMAEGAEEETDNSQRERIPLRWVAPECYKSTQHATEKSDVWSFGVVLWEIFSLGDNPYSNLKTHEIPVKVKGGYRMTRPEYADDINDNIMQQCWELEPKRRPKFKELEMSYSTLMTGGAHADYSENYSNYAR